MRILFISQYFPPEMGAPAARVSETARAWAAQGHQVTVITGLGSHPTGVVPEQYRGRLFIRERRDGYDVVRVWLFSTPNSGVGKRIINFVSFFASATVLGSLLSPEVDVVIATTPQIFIGAAGALVARLKRRPFVLEVRDLWPKTAIDLGVVKSKPLIAVLERLERWLYRSAKLVVVVSEEFVDHVKETVARPQRIAFVPNGVDADGILSSLLFGPPETRRIPGVVTVSYVGTHGMCQGLSTIVRVAERFRNDPGIRFLFVGEGAEKAAVQRLAEQAGLQNCVFVDGIPREQVASVYRDSDICLVPLLDRPVFRSVLPSKMFEIMAFARPIVLSVGGRAEALLTSANAGIAAPPEDVEAITSAIKELADDPQRRANLGENGRRYLKANFDRSVLANQYLNALREVVA